MTDQSGEALPGVTVTLTGAGGPEVRVTDRINVGGNESGQQSQYVTLGLRATRRSGRSTA